MKKLIICCLVGLFIAGCNYSDTNDPVKQNLNQPVPAESVDSSLPDNINLQVNESEPAKESIPKEDDIYLDYPGIDKTAYEQFGIKPEPGYQLFLSSLSHNGQMLVYSEVKLHYNEDDYADKSDYYIYLQKKNDAKILLHECHNDYHADICDLPFGWSKNDQVMIFRDEGLTGGSGAFHVGYLTAINLKNLKQKYELASYQNYLNKDNTKVISLETNEQSPLYCCAGENENSGRLRVIDIESNNLDFEQAETNFNYNVLEVKANSFIFEKVKTEKDKLTDGNATCCVLEGQRTKYEYGFATKQYKLQAE